MKEIELHKFNKRDTETLAEICLEYLSEKGIRPEVWSFQIKCFIDSEIEQFDEEHNSSIMFGVDNEQN